MSAISNSGVTPIQMELTDNPEFTKNQERMEKIKQWKRKSWLDFCKLVMEQDKRYTLLPLSDYSKLMHSQQLGLARANGIFGNMCLRRDGERSDIYIVPLDPNLGIAIDAGSKFTKMTLSGFPSRSLVWPVLRIADDLERQFTREVMIEANKHNTFAKPSSEKKTRARRTNGKSSTSSSVGHNDSDQLPTSEEADR